MVGDSYSVVPKGGLSSSFFLNQRRGRLSGVRRRLLRDVLLDHGQFIQPYFVAPSTRLDDGSSQAVPGLPGVFRDDPESFYRRIIADREQGVRGGLIFVLPPKKIPGRVKHPENPPENFDHEFSAQVLEEARRHVGKDFFLAADVCFCSHTEHGHCGVLNAEGDHLENNATVQELARAATIFAQAGVDCVAPSDMMDGRVGALRQALDAQGHDDVLLMSYSIKIHSRFYGPFRLAADSAPTGGVPHAGARMLKDRATYQIDPAHGRDALACALRDAREGADILMVKPGLPALDFLTRASAHNELCSKPWAVYEVSGEYAAIELLGERDLINAPAAHVESWLAFKRAGAQIIISYGARHARRWIQEWQEGTL